MGAGTLGRQKATGHLLVPRGQRAHVRGHSPAVVRVRSLCGMATAAAAPARAAWLGHPCGLCSPAGGGCSARHRRLVTKAPGWEALAGWSGPGFWVLFALGPTSSDAFFGLDALFLRDSPSALANQLSAQRPLDLWRDALPQQRMEWNCHGDSSPPPASPAPGCGLSLCLRPLCSHSLPRAAEKSPGWQDPADGLEPDGNGCHLTPGQPACSLSALGWTTWTAQ